MSVYYEATYPVDSRAVDPWGHCRPSAVLGILQEAATEASVRLGISREEVIEHYHVFWMLARVWYRLSRPLGWDEQLTVRTWHRGGRGAAMYRDFDLSVGGRPVGEAVSSWVLADVDTHKLFRLSQVAEFQDTTGGALCKERLLTKLHPPGNLEVAEHRLLHYSDADVNGHVNNARYADFACDALHMEHLGAGQFVSALQVGYLKECRPGEYINLCTGEAQGQSFVRGLGADATPRFDAALTCSALG